MKTTYHLVGAAGVGMSPLAELLLDLGHVVTGSDRFLDQGVAADALSVLRARGARLFPQDGSGVTSETTTVVASTAVEPDNPDLAAARARGIPMLHRAEMLAHCAAGARLLAVAGTSGKTTTTAMLGWILTEAGLDPTVVNGGAVTAWRGADRTGSVRRGPSDLWVVEVDESDRSLLRFTPEWAVITNISRDHFPLPETIRLFQDFAARVRREIVCFPDAADLLALPPDRVVTAEDEAGVFAGPAGDELRIAGETVRVPLPGRHNLENAALAARLALRVGAAPAAVRTALARFPGVARRLEMVAPPARGVRVLDDYGHNPAKISAAWRAAAADARRVLGVWRPHGFRPLAEMMDDLADAFAAVCRPEDELFLLPVFFAGGTVVRSADSGELAERLRARGARARTVAGYDELRKALLDALRPGDTALIMGARDPELPRFARALAADWAAR